MIVKSIIMMKSSFFLGPYQVEDVIFCVVEAIIVESIFYILDSFFSLGFWQFI